MSAADAGLHDLHTLLAVAERLQTSDIAQVKMLGVRVHALTRSLLDSTIVDESLLEPWTAS